MGDIRYLVFQPSQTVNVREDIELPTGEIIPVNFDAETAFLKFMAAHAIAGDAALLYAKDPGNDEAADAYRCAYYKLIEVLLTSEGAAQMLASYDGNMNELIMMLDPWINDTIYPAIEEACSRFEEHFK